MRANVFLFAVLCAGVALPCCANGGEEAGTVLFKSDFEKDDVGKSAADLGFVVIGEGDFHVALDGKNKVLELAPTPLDTHGFLFGPNESENVSVQARVFGTASGRRFPLFGIGIGGVGGYMLRLQPVRKVLEVLKADQVKKAVPYTWTSNTWTVLALSVRKAQDGAWVIEGKAWEDGKEEPKEPLLSFADNEKPTAGRAGLWGIPYSGELIRFDDLLVRKVK
ncbi:MAG: hypothetical protein NTW87_31300 [Planctomycetota bacterium]|nr:hypothetical protein [Planctomycetota bacterium]